MNNFDPAVYNEEYENGYVENQNFKPFVIKNLLNKDEISHIYDLVKQSNDHMLQSFVGHRACSFKYPQFVEKITQVITEYIGEEMVLKEYSFAKYSTEFGYKPKLFPHYDTHSLDGQRITVDIQLNKNIDWAVVVEGESFNFNIGDALVFSGTQQIHWREKKELFSGDEVDMIFAHFAYKKEKPWTFMQKEILEYKSHRIRESLEISNQPERYE